MKQIKCRRSGFTLVEILVVITLIILMMSMFKSSLSKLFTGNSVDYAASSFKSYCGMVRAQAAVEKEDMAILMVTQIPIGKEKPIADSDELFAYRAYRAGKLTETGNANEYKVEWVKGSKWEFLPMGAYFELKKGRYSVYEDDPDTVISCINPENSDSTHVTFKAKRLVFKGNSRTGTGYNNNGYTIRIAEGTLTEESTEPTAALSNIYNSLYVKINVLNGKAKVSTTR